MVTQNPQLHMEEEHLEVAGLLDFLKAWQKAEGAWKANGDQLDKARKEAKKKVIALVPQDGKPHLFRLDEFQIKVSPHDESDIEFTRTAGERVSLKVVGG